MGREANVRCKQIGSPRAIRGYYEILVNFVVIENRCETLLSFSAVDQSSQSIVIKIFDASYELLKKLSPEMPALSKNAWLRARASPINWSQPKSSIEPWKPLFGR